MFKKESSESLLLFQNAKNKTAVKLTAVSCAPVVEVKIKRPDTKYQLGFSVQNGVVRNLTLLDGFDQHYQASVRFLLNSAADKSRQYQELKSCGFRELNPGQLGEKPSWEVEALIQTLACCVFFGNEKFSWLKQPSFLLG